MKDIFFKRISHFSVILVILIFISVFALQSEIRAYEMGSDNYRIQESSINVGGLDSQTSTNYKLRETIGETVIGTATSTSYKLQMGYQPMIASFISLSVSTSSVELLPIIGAVAGGVATSSYSATVITDNGGGYSLYVEASTDPALKSGANSFTDYLPVSIGVPDFNWSVDSNTSGFGFTTEGIDVAQKFLDNGLDECATSSSNTADACWYGFSTSSEPIATAFLPNVPAGTETTVKLKAESGSSNYQAAGAYQATITTSAIAL